MAEYIEIEQLWKCETCYYNDKYGCTLGLGCDHGESYRPVYSKLKRADVEPVRHGRWLPQILLGRGVWDCSECKTLGSPHWKRCPVCEAKMGLEGGNT